MNLPFQRLKAWVIMVSALVLVIPMGLAWTGFVALEGQPGEYSVQVEGQSEQQVSGKDTYISRLGQSETSAAKPGMMVRRVESDQNRAELDTTALGLISLVLIVLGVIHASRHN